MTTKAIVNSISSTMTRISMISQAQWLCVILTSFFEREPTISTITRERLTEVGSVQTQCFL